MRILLPAVLSLLFAGVLAGQEPDYINVPTKDPSTKSGVYVPKDLQDAFKELSKMLDPRLVAKMKNGPEKDMIKYHHGLGTWLRNNWMLWGGGRMAKFFNTKGVRHPDDMSGIILTSFWRHLNNKPLNFEKQCAWYVAYWDSTKKPDKQIPLGTEPNYTLY